MHPEAVLLALRHVWLTLRPLEVPMAVMGGLAMSAWKYPRATRDVDLLLVLPGRDPTLALQRLQAANVRPKSSRPAVRLGPLDVVQLLYEPPDAFIDVQIDLLLGDSDYFREALRRRVPARLPDLDLEIAVLACEDLVLNKLMAARIIDRADAASLLRANRGSLDWDYLKRWIEELKVGNLWTEIWHEAFPEESR